MAIRRDVNEVICFGGKQAVVHRIMYFIITDGLYIYIFSDGRFYAGKS